MLKEVEVDMYKPNVYGLVTSLWIQTLFNQNDSEWPEIDFKHNF